MKPKERNGAGRGEEKKEWEGRGGGEGRKEKGVYEVLRNQILLNCYNHSLRMHELERSASTLYTRCSAIAERPRCRVRYSFRQ